MRDPTGDHAHGLNPGTSPLSTHASQYTYSQEDSNCETIHPFLGHMYYLLITMDQRVQPLGDGGRVELRESLSGQ